MLRFWIFKFHFRLSENFLLYLQKIFYCSLGYLLLLPFPDFPDVLLPSLCLCLSLLPLLQRNCYSIFHLTILILAPFICHVPLDLLPKSPSLPLSSPMPGSLFSITHSLCRLNSRLQVSAFLVSPHKTFCCPSPLLF